MTDRWFSIVLWVALAVAGAYFTYTEFTRRAEVEIAKSNSSLEQLDRGSRMDNCIREHGRSLQASSQCNVILRQQDRWRRDGR